ncbi:MAG: DNA-binding LytR/AlgR family response regulator [Dokdonia sp.]|jgi:DNA-binding LytR/AlgR family response regulator
MKYHPYYLYTALSLSVLYVIIALIATPFFMRLSMNNALSNDIEAAQQEAYLIASMSEGITEKNDKTKLKERIQKSINNTNTKNVFISVLDWSGEYLCYPDNKRIGDTPPLSEALASGIQNELTSEVLYDMVFKKEDTVSTSEIIRLTPVVDSDWIIASHINKERVIEQANNIRSQLYLVFLIIGLITLIFFLASIRIISSYYERQLALKSTKLEDGVLNLSKLNASLDNYQKNLSDFKRERQEEQKLAEQQKQLEEQVETTAVTEEAKISKTTTKQRILTYVRNELLPVATEDISYIYVENTITYIVRKDGKRSTSSESLDLIYSYLDEKLFFRANRQIIVAISAIETITKFGNSKLKIQVNPASEIDIVIGKNKASAFKQWLDL